MGTIYNLIEIERLMDDLLKISQGIEVTVSMGNLLPILDFKGLCHLSLHCPFAFGNLLHDRLQDFASTHRPTPFLKVKPVIFE